MISKSFCAELSENNFLLEKLTRPSNRCLTPNDCFLPKNFVPRLKPKETIFIEEEGKTFSLHLPFYDEKENKDSFYSTDEFSSDEETQFIINISDKKKNEKKKECHHNFRKIKRKKIINVKERILCKYVFFKMIIYMLNLISL